MILFLTNNQITKPLYAWLKKQDKVVIFSDKISLDFLSKINPNLIISYNYKYIISKDIVQKYKIINLHISYLPFNKGAYPNIFSHITNTPSGVTIHYIDEGIDSGDIIIQKKVEIDENETLNSSYIKLHQEIQKLFIENYPKLLYIPPKPQTKEGNINYIKDFEKIKKFLPLGFETTIKTFKELYENRQL